MEKNIKVDIIKGFAIISVLLLHSTNMTQVTGVYSYFHVGHAVPMFIFIAGYVSTLSFSNKGCRTLRECYNLEYLLKRFNRILIPFIFIFIFELTGSQITLGNILHGILHGGYGPGNYFIPLFLQHVILFPIIYYLLVMKKDYVIPICFFISIIYEVISQIYEPVGVYYSETYLRYAFAATLGGYMALYQMNKILLYVGALSSVIYIYISYYTDLNIFGHGWIAHQAPSFFYTAFLYSVGMKLLPDNVGLNPFYGKIAEIGRSSWHIFLIQMLFGWKFDTYSDSFFLIALNLIAWIPAGLMFYHANLEQKIIGSSIFRLGNLESLPK